MARSAAAHRAVDGILLLDKEAGPSSNQCLQRVRRLLAARKAGHAGTLDPLATGLLPLLFGEATKFAGSLSEADKAYRATVLLGVTTTTGDLAGEVLTRRPAAVALDRLLAVAARFEGEIVQVPPMHSALKVDGRPLYERARRGETVERSPRAVRVSKLTLCELRGDECDIDVHCSKGTYVRVLAEDMGKALGCGATLKRLRRTWVGPFDVAAAVTLDELESRGAQWAEGRLLPMDAALVHLPAVWLDPVQVRQVSRGQCVPIAAAPSWAHARLYDAESRRFIGLGDFADGVLRPRRLVCSNDQGGACSRERQR